MKKELILTLIIGIVIGIVVNHYLGVTKRTDVEVKTETRVISLIKEREDCKKLGGDFFISQGWLGDYEIRCYSKQVDLFANPATDL